MILRKPYAFLIKHFKLIHLIMFGILGYLVFPLREIYMFFRNYAKTSTFVYSNNLTNKYIDIKLFLLVLIITIMAIAIYLLMRKKQKPVFFYIILIIYSILLFGGFVYLRGIFNSLQYRTYEPLDIVVFRDISLFMYIINFFYLGFNFVRGFGFDIKKFMFEKDLKELHLEESDSEEYEFNINIDKDNLKSYFRRQKREMGYYFKENAKTLIILFSGIVLIGIGIGYHFLFVENKIYSEGESISIGNTSFTVQNTLLTNKDSTGIIINDNSDIKYIIVYLNIQNKGSAFKMDRDFFRINNNNKYYLMYGNNHDKFSDLGVIYTDQVVANNSNNNYILLFKCEDKIDDELYLEMEKNKSSLSYYRIKINPQLDEKITKQYQLNEEVSVNDQKIKVVDYKFIDNTSYKYEECFNDKCSIYTKSIVPKLGETILSLNIVDDELDDVIFENNFGIKYEMGEIMPDRLKFLGRNKNQVYFSVPLEMKNKNNIILTIKFRKMESEIILKGD